MELLFLGLGGFVKVLNFHKKKGLFLLCCFPYMFFAASDDTVQNQPINEKSFSNVVAAQSVQLGGQAVNLMGDFFSTIKKIANLLTQPDVLRLEAALVGVTIPYGLGKTFWNRYQISLIEHKFLDTDKTGIVKKPMKVYNWGMEEYPTACGIKNRRNEFRRDFEVAWVHLAIQHDSSLAWHKNVINTVDREISELGSYLKILRTFVFCPSRAYDLIGIDKIFKKSCTRCAIDSKKFHINELTVEQETELDNAMKATLKTTVRHWICLCPNFGKASSLYWEILKRIKRLESIKGVIYSCLDSRKKTQEC